MNATDAVFYIAILIMSVVIHEVCHGYMALRYGDKTALYAGRLTLNPLSHLDLFGSIILPALLYFSTGYAFGWARPVPYNPDNLRDRKWGTVAVASAGILANLSLATFFGLILRFTNNYNLPDGFSLIVSTIVIVNLALGLFNLVPIPPLDGSKILIAFLPARMSNFVLQYERYSIIFLIIFVTFFSSYLIPIISFMFHLITGMII